MRTTFTILTIILILVGFIMPLAWVGAAVFGLLAIASAPPGLRPDGKKKTGGLFGGASDNMQLKHTMKECPYCKSKIMKDAKKCPHCAEWLVDKNQKGSIRTCDWCKEAVQPNEETYQMDGNILCSKCFNSRVPDR